MALLDLTGIKSAIVGPLSKLITSIRQTIDTAVHIFDVVHETINDAVEAYEIIKNFDINPHWKIRALSAPEAIDNVKELARLPTQLVIAVRDLVSRVKESISAFKSPAAEAEAAIAEAGTLEGGILRFFPRLTALLGKAITRVLAIAGLIVQLVIDVDNAIADIHTIVAGFKTAFEALNKLDAVFLQQNNPRKTVVLEDGTKMKIRVGSLHKA